MGNHGRAFRIHHPILSTTPTSGENGIIPFPVCKSRYISETVLDRIKVTINHK